MYQITLGTAKGLGNWIDLLGSKIRPLVKNSGVVVIAEDKDRIFLGVGSSENKNFENEVSKVLYDFFLKDLKEEYLYSNIKRYAKNDYLVRVYIKVLNLFNTDEEKEILNEAFCLYPNFSLDGFYRFRLGPLKEKWDDLVMLSVNNMDLIRDDYSLIMLIKHLVACLPTVCDSVFVDYTNGEYKITFATGEELLAENVERVVFLLIDRLPERIHLSEESAKNGLAEHITTVFDVKFVEII